MPKVSAIVPFYNVERFIGRCAESLLSQTIDGLEIIFVDDASPDGSRAVLEEVIARHPGADVRILTHEVNKGLPAARNTGLAQASGEFIYHCDSDDWLEPGILEKMYSAAVGAGADYAYCDFFLTFPGNEKYMGNPTYASAEEMLKKGFLAGNMKFNVWNKLVRRDVYVRSGIVFPAGHGMGEDTTMIMLAARSVGAVHVPQAGYHYVKSNPNAFTNTVSERHMTDFQHNFDRTVAYLEGCDFSEKEKYLSLFKLSLVIPCLTNGRWKMAEFWEQKYPEAFGDIFANDAMPLRTKAILWLGKKKLYPVLSVYNFLVNKVYYGLRYRQP